MAGDEKIQRASGLLAHYFRTAFEAAGLKWESDNAAEIRETVEVLGDLVDLKIAEKNAEAILKAANQTFSVGGVVKPSEAFLVSPGRGPEVFIPFARPGTPAPSPGFPYVDKAAAGLYPKYRVERTDGTDQPGGKHEGCRYFVLDLDHDFNAIPALMAYAARAEEKYPVLAKDLRQAARDLEAARREAEGEGPPPRIASADDDPPGAATGAQLLDMLTRLSFEALDLPVIGPENYTPGISRASEVEDAVFSGTPESEAFPTWEEMSQGHGRRAIRLS